MSVYIIKRIDKLIEAFETSQINDYPEYYKLFSALNFIKQLHPDLNYDKYKPFLISHQKRMISYYLLSLKRFEKGTKGWQSNVKDYYNKISSGLMNEYDVMIERIKKEIIHPYYERIKENEEEYEESFSLPVPQSQILGEIKNRGMF